MQHLAESPLCNLAAESEPEAPSAAPLLPAKQDLPGCLSQHAVSEYITVDDSTDGDLLLGSM